MIQGELKLEVWTLIIEKSTVIPPSLMVLFTFNPQYEFFPQVAHSIANYRRHVYETMEQFFMECFYESFWKYMIAELL